MHTPSMAAGWQRALPDGFFPRRLRRPVKILDRVLNPREIRRRLGMNQEQFWTQIGVTQSGGSRYESGREMPKPVRELLRLVHVEQIDLSQVKRVDFEIISYLKEAHPDLYRSLRRAVRSRHRPGAPALELGEAEEGSRKHAPAAEPKAVAPHCRDQRHGRGGDDEAVGDGPLRRHDSELSADHDPGRAPNGGESGEGDRDGEINSILHRAAIAAASFSTTCPSESQLVTSRICPAPQS